DRAERVVGIGSNLDAADVQARLGRGPLSAAQPRGADQQNRHSSKHTTVKNVQRQHLLLRSGLLCAHNKKRRFGDLNSSNDLRFKSAPRRQFVVSHQARACAESDAGERAAWATRHSPRVIHGSSNSSALALKYPPTTRILPSSSGVAVCP